MPIDLSEYATEEGDRVRVELPDGKPARTIRREAYDRLRVGDDTRGYRQAIDAEALDERRSHAEDERLARSSDAANAVTFTDEGEPGKEQIVPLPEDRGRQPVDAVSEVGPAEPEDDRDASTPLRAVGRSEAGEGTELEADAERHEPAFDAHPAPAVAPATAAETPAPGPRGTPAGGSKTSGTSGAGTKGAGTKGGGTKR
jgi:hypothetical protein